MKKAIGIILSVIGWITAVLCFLGLLGGIGTLVQSKGSPHDPEVVGLIWLLLLGTAAGILFIVLGKLVRTYRKQEAQDGAGGKKGLSPLSACVLAFGVLFFIGGIILRVFPSGAAKTNVSDVSVSGETEAVREEEPKSEPEPEQEPEPEPEQVIAARMILEKTYENRVFDESLNLAEHPGLLNHSAVTGPFLRLVMEDGKPYVPDVTGDETPDPALPEGVRIVSAADGDIPDEYLDLLLTPEKEEAVSEGRGVFALLEYTGYGGGTEYLGAPTIYYHRSRISFYDLSTGEMAAWVNTTDVRSSPTFLKFGDFSGDGQHSLLLYDNGTVWDHANLWTKGLNELFYDENGYQVVGTRLLSVPEDADPVVIPEGVTRIEEDVAYKRQFQNTALVLPEGLESIGYAAFCHTNLETAVIPDSVRFMDMYAFDDTPWMESIMDGDYVIVGDGVLLKARAQGDEITLPEEVRYVMPTALNGLSCRKLTIPETVLQLCGSHDFSPISSSDLETLVIRGGLENVLGIPNIIVQAAHICKSLKTVVVDCDAADLPSGWLRMNKEDKEQLTIYCREGSAVEKWAEKNGVKHLPLSEYEP